MRAPLTHCRRGHAFTPDNTQQNTSSALRDGKRVTVQTRLCKICLRERQRGYAKPQTYEPRAPLPADPYEVDVERIVRRVNSEPSVSRSQRLAQSLDPWDVSVEVPHPAFPNESYREYATRTPPDPWRYTWWLASRVLGDPRINGAVTENS